VTIHVWWDNLYVTSCSHCIQRTFENFCVTCISDVMGQFTCDETIYMWRVVTRACHIWMVSSHVNCHNCHNSLRVGSLKLLVSFAKGPYERDDQTWIVTTVKTVYEWVVTRTVTTWQHINSRNIDVVTIHVWRDTSCVTWHDNTQIVWEQKQIAKIRLYRTESDNLSLSSFNVR